MSLLEGPLKKAPVAGDLGGEGLPVGETIGETSSSYGLPLAECNFCGGARVVGGPNGTGQADERGESTGFSDAVVTGFGASEFLMSAVAGGLSPRGD